MPLCRTNPGICGRRYIGASVWNSILSVNINTNVSQFILPGSLKAAICDNLFKVRYHMCVNVILQVVPFECNFQFFISVAPFAPLLKYACYMWNQRSVPQDFQFALLQWWYIIVFVLVFIVYADMNMLYTLQCLVGSNTAILNLESCENNCIKLKNVYMLIVFVITFNVLVCLWLKYI